MIDLQRLYWDGIAVLPEPWTGVAEFREHLRQQPAFNSHVRAKAKIRYESVDSAWECGEELVTHNQWAVLGAPGFFELACGYTALAAEYLGAPALMYSCNAFWTRPGTSPANPDIQEWHRDRDDEKFLALFLLGTETDTRHLYSVGSHRQPDDGNHPPDPVTLFQVKGPAGTLFFEDPRGLHLGEKPQSGERLLAWARWGVSDPPRSYLWDKLQPMPGSRLGFTPDEDIRNATRLVVDWSK